VIYIKSKPSFARCPSCSYKNLVRVKKARIASSWNLTRIKKIKKKCVRCKQFFTYNLILKGNKYYLQHGDNK